MQASSNTQASTTPSDSENLTVTLSLLTHAKWGTTAQTELVYSALQKEKQERLRGMMHHHSVGEYNLAALAWNSYSAIDDLQQELAGKLAGLAEGNYWQVMKAKQPTGHARLMDTFRQSEQEIEAEYRQEFGIADTVVTA